jgi:hypothetical protein
MSRYGSKATCYYIRAQNKSRDMCVYVSACVDFTKEAQRHIMNNNKIPEHKAESTSAQPWETSMEAFAEVKYHVQKRRICHHAKLNNLIKLK